MMNWTKNKFKKPPVRMTSHTLHYIRYFMLLWLHRACSFLLQRALLINKYHGC